MANATYGFYLDWNGDGDFGDVGEDVTARTLTRSPVTIRMGRDQSRALSPMAISEARLELNNASGDYSPENPASPLAGNVLPGRGAYLKATLSAVDYALYRGHTDDHEVLPGLDDRSVQITCLDPLAKLKDVRVDTEVYPAVQTGTAIGYLLDAVGWPSAARNLDVGATTIPFWWVDGQDAYAALQAILDAEGPPCLATVDSDGNIVFRDRHHRITSVASTTSQVTFRDTGAEPLFSPPLVVDHGWRDIVNSVTFDIPVRGPSGELSVVWSTQGQVAIADGQTIPIAAKAGQPFLGAVVPEVDTDYTLLSGTVSMTLSRTSGQSATVFVTASGGPAVIADLALRAYSIDTITTAQVTAEETVSVGRYGRRSWPSGRDPVLASLNDAIAIADIILAHRAERLPTVTIRLTPGNTTRLTQQLARDLSDRVTIVEASTGLNADFYLEQISHEIAEAGLYHTTTFGCEKAPTPPAGVLILDDAALGLLDTGTLGSVGLSDPDTVYLLDDSGQGLLDTGLLAY